MNLLALLLASQLYGDPPPKKSAFVPGERLSRSWRRHIETPFVRDTLAPLVGQPVIVKSSPRPPMGHDLLRALTLPYGYPASSNNPTEVRLYEEGASDDLFTHEVGHVLDYKGIAPAAADSVRARFERDKPRFRYGGKPVTDYGAGSGEQSEYVAEAFARALESGRRGFADSTKVDQQMPGAIEFIRWLQTRPPFAKDGPAAPPKTRADSSLAGQLDSLLAKRAARPQP